MATRKYLGPTPLSLPIASLTFEKEVSIGLFDKLVDALMVDLRQLHDHVRALEQDSYPLVATAYKPDEETALLLRQKATGAVPGAHANFDDKAGDPAPLVTGDLWRSGDSLKFRQSSATVDLTSAGAGGDNIQVNAGAVTDANFNDTVPAVPGGDLNVLWQSSGASPTAISAYVDISALDGILLPVLAAGTRDFTANQSMGGFNLTGIGRLVGNSTSSLPIDLSTNQYHTLGVDATWGATFFGDRGSGFRCAYGTDGNNLMAFGNTGNLRFRLAGNNAFEVAPSVSNPFWTVLQGREFTFRVNTPVSLNADPLFTFDTNSANKDTGSFVEFNNNGTIIWKTDYDGTTTQRGPMYMEEQAAAGGSTATWGQLWVKTATPNQLWFTDDGGTDHQLGVGGVSTHVVLDSTVHTDTLTGTVVEGDLIIGNSTPKWARLPRVAGGRYLRDNSVTPIWDLLQISDDTDPDLGGDLNCVNFDIQNCREASIEYAALGVNGGISRFVKIVDVDHTFTGSTANMWGVLNEITWDPSLNVGSNVDLRGIGSLVDTDLGDTHTYAGGNVLIAFVGQTNHQAAVSIPETSVYEAAALCHASATIVDAFGYRNLTGLGTGTITNAFGFYHTGWGAQPSNKWSFYAAADPAYFADYIDIDDITVPTGNPPSGTRRLFTNTATGELSVKTSAGDTVSLEAASFARETFLTFGSREVSFT